MEAERQALDAEQGDFALAVASAEASVEIAIDAQESVMEEEISSDEK